MLRRQFISILSAIALIGCTTALPNAPKTGTHTKHVIATALWNEPVFDNDVNDFERAFSSASSSKVSSHKLSARTALPDFTEEIGDVYLDTVEQMQQGDQLVSFITSHGYKNLVGIKTANLEVAAYGEDLNELFTTADDFAHIIVIQACYSGSLIPALKNRNRIIITAADPNHPSFGCEPDAQNTWFTKALKGEIKPGRSWTQIFTATKAKVAAYEASQGVPAGQGSNPQMYIGANMKDIANAPI